MAFTEVTDADLAPLPKGFTEVSDADLADPHDDKVAPYGLSGVVAGKTGAASAPATSVAQAVNLGVGSGGSMGFGDELGAAVETGVSKIPGLRSFLQTVREHLPGDASSGVPLTDSSATYAQRRDAIRGHQHKAQADQPTAYLGGELAGGLVTTAVPGLGVAKGASALKAAAAGARAGALSGLGNSEADTLAGAAGDTAGGALLGGALGGLAHKIFAGAPTRVDKRLVANISRGEAGGAAKDKLYRNVVAKAGEEFENLNETLQHYQGVKEALVKKAASNPGKATKTVEAAMSKVGGELDNVYAAIDKGPVSATAGDVLQGLATLKQKLVDRGSTGMADVVDNYANHLAKHYKPTDAVTGSMMRKLRQEVGEVAFKNMDQASSGFKAQAKQMIYGGLNSAIEFVAEKTPGVDVNRLRTLNKDASMLIAVRDALTDRAGKAAGGRTGLAQLMTAATMIGGGGAAGGVEGALSGAALAAGMKAALPIARGIDYKLARLVEAANAGSKPAQLAQLALELGFSRVAAQEIAKRGLGALQGPPAASAQEAAP
jgi:hypothetical protein